MKNFKAISMDCNREQFESMKQELIELGCKLSGYKPEDEVPTIVNNWDGTSKLIGNTFDTRKNLYNRTYIGAFDKEAFLQACGKVEEVNVSGWYISTIGNKWMMYVDYDKGIKFGFGVSGAWANYEGGHFGNAIKATTEQVLQRLTEEADKRGYKEGVTVKSMYNNGTGFLSHNNTRILQNNALVFGSVTIMKNGIWADIVQNDIEVVEPVYVSELAELKKEKTSLLKSRNRYKQLYQQEKKRAVFMEDKIKKDIIYYSELSEDKRLYNAVLAQKKQYIFQYKIMLCAVIAMSAAYVIFTLC